LRKIEIIVKFPGEDKQYNKRLLHFVRNENII